MFDKFLRPLWQLYLHARLFDPGLGDDKVEEGEVDEDGEDDEEAEAPAPVNVPPRHAMKVDGVHEVDVVQDSHHRLQQQLGDPLRPHLPARVGVEEGSFSVRGSDVLVYGYAGVYGGEGHPAAGRVGLGDVELHPANSVKSLSE